MNDIGVCDIITYSQITITYFNKSFIIHYIYLYLVASTVKVPS